MKLQLITLGCSKNRVDSEHLLKQIEQAGIIIVPESEDVFVVKPDVIVINTCGFIQDAKTESIEAILSAVAVKQNGLVKKVFVCGCLSQRYFNELKHEIPEVDAFFGADDQPGILKALGISFSPSLACCRHLTTPSHYAFLKISEGCDRNCSYCAIPLIRGPHRSVPMEQLLQEAEILAANGVKELIVIAQDTTYYGLDLYQKRMLAPLLEKLSEIKGIEWIRIHYSYPAAFPMDVLELMAVNSKICKYLDIPLQHS
ncbi:MAG: radical SAM protein, partial [Bacteroidales bacterium]|nr:radical SAM protein [Bacteroidales bacterium]